MRIAYLLHWNDGPESGVFKKVLDQTRYWSARGCEVKVFLFNRDRTGNDKRYQNLDIAMAVVSYGSLVNRFASMRKLVADVINWAPDLVYTRYDLYYPSLAALAAAMPVVLEVNTDDITEYRTRPFYVYWYNLLTRKRLLAAADGTVFVSRELSAKPYFARYSRKIAVISNGIDLSRYAPGPPAANPAPRLVFMGTPNQVWQGVDKLVNLAWHLPQWHFDLIGFAAEHVKERIPPNVALHGFMERPGYEKLLIKADAAFGTMALHRKQMEEASPLKVREYLAYGLPVIISYKDTDFPATSRFILSLPNNADNISGHITEIKSFVERVKGTRVPRESIQHIDVMFKEQDRFEFMCAVAEEMGAGAAKSY